MHVLDYLQGIYYDGFNTVHGRSRERKEKLAGTC